MLIYMQTAAAAYVDAGAACHPVWCAAAHAGGTEEGDHQPLPNLRPAIQAS